MGDNRDNGKSWACYNNAGMPCAPGDGACPCLYLNASAVQPAPPGTGAGQCVICPPLPTSYDDVSPPEDPCNNALGCGPWAPGVFYGDCNNANFQKTAAGNFSRLARYGSPSSGPVACVGQPGVYYTSAIPNTNNQRLACFNYNGVACQPGAPGCPCDYLQTYDPAATQFASINEFRGSYQCLVCPPVATVPVVNAPSPPPPPPAQQAVEYGVCSQVFTNLFASTPAPFVPGGWTGRVSCTTDPSTQSYWVGDAVECVHARLVCSAASATCLEFAGACRADAPLICVFTLLSYHSAGASLACFNAYGGKCMANTAGCPCQILTVYKTASGQTSYAQNNGDNGGAQKCVVCPPALAVASNLPQGVIYQPCGSSSFAAAGIPPLPNSGTWTGLAYCNSVPNSPGFWVGDGYEYVHSCCAIGAERLPPSHPPSL